MDLKTSAETFDQLWNRMHEPVCWFVCSRVSNLDDAEDILQDVFTRVYTQMETVHDMQRLEGWVYQIARNRVIDYYRRRRLWVDLDESLALPENDEENPAVVLLPHLKDAVGMLPEPYREALVLADLQGTGQKELAAQTGISLSGAKSRVQRARQMVKQSMLACFDFEFDTLGRVMDYSPRCCC